MRHKVSSQVFGHVWTCGHLVSSPRQHSMNDLLALALTHLLTRVLVYSLAPADLLTRSLRQSLAHLLTYSTWTVIASICVFVHGQS